MTLLFPDLLFLSYFVESEALPLPFFRKASDMAVVDKWWDPFHISDSFSRPGTGVIQALFCSFCVAAESLSPDRLPFLGFF